MPAKQNGPAGWIIEKKLKGSSQFERKYREVLTELSKFVGAACNTGDIEAFQFLIHYTTMIFEGGFEVLKESFEEDKKTTFEDFKKRMGMGKN